MEIQGEEKTYIKKIYLFLHFKGTIVFQSF